jgi:hypothetical protein
VESNAALAPLPRAKTLGAGDQRVICATLAASWWRDACEAYPLGGAGVARFLGTDRATVHRYGTGEKLLPLRDVIAAPLPVQRRVLGLALDRLDTSRPDVTSLRVEAILVCSEAAQVALTLERGDLERLDASALDSLLSLIDTMIDRLMKLRRRLWRERQRRGE